MLTPLNITKTSAEAEEFIILGNLIYYIKKLPVTEPGAKKNKIRSKLLLLVLVLYHYSISRQNKKTGQTTGHFLY